MVENTDLAIAKACKMTHAEIVDYTVAPFSWSIEKKGAHEWMIEFKKAQNAFTLSKKYRRHLKTKILIMKQNVTITRPWILVINVARENLFYEWLKERDKLGGQHKIPRLSKKRLFRTIERDAV
jgi:hypothetical protein